LAGTRRASGICITRTLIIEELNKAVAGHSEMHSVWEGNTETALYFYGDNAGQMAEWMAEFLDSYPLCKGAPVVTIAPRQENDHPEKPHS
jgi:hypothetical protein